MPYTGQVDLTDILAKLGDPSHGLRAGAVVNSNIKDDEHIYRASLVLPVDMSTSMTIEPAWVMIWDTNSYYRDLGFGWPYKPTKQELRLAYQELDGPNNPRLTYVFKQLIDPKIRAEYDATPLGNRFHDRYVEEEQMRLLTEIAKEESQEKGRVVTVQDLIEEVKSARNTALEDPELEQLSKGMIHWDWGFYLMNSRKFQTEDLQLWQGFLISAFAKRGVRRKISIGYVGKTKKRFIVRQHEGKVIFFLNEITTPTMELALEATASRKSRSGRKAK